MSDLSAVILGLHNVDCSIKPLRTEGPLQYWTLCNWMGVKAVKYKYTVKFQVHVHDSHTKKSFVVVV